MKSGELSPVGNPHLVYSILDKCMLAGELDNLKKRRNQVQKEVAAKKKAGEECEAMVKEIKDIGDTIDAKEVEQKELKVVVDKVQSMEIPSYCANKASAAEQDREHRS